MSTVIVIAIHCVTSFIYVVVVAATVVPYDCFIFKRKQQKNSALSYICGVSTCHHHPAASMYRRLSPFQCGWGFYLILLCPASLIPYIVFFLYEVCLIVCTVHWYCFFLPAKRNKIKEKKFKEMKELAMCKCMYVCVCVGLIIT